MKIKYSLILLTMFCKISNAQIDLQCDGRDAHSIYLVGGNFGVYHIYRIDSVDTHPTNPITVSSCPTSHTGGISINSNFDSVQGPTTMYFADDNSYYYFWNGTGWTNTNHTSGISGGAYNPGGSANYIFNLDGNANAVYRYDGTGNAILIDSNLNTYANADYDIATDNQGNFYIFYIHDHKIIAFNPSGIPVDSFTTTGTASPGAGLALVGNRFYAADNNVLYEGIKTGNNVNFTSIKSFSINVDDIASCPAVGTPLGVYNSSSLQYASVYPNPMGNVLNIQFNTNQNSEVIIYDMLSNKLLHEKFINSVSLNTGQLTKGIYFYELRNDKGTLKTGKIVKQ